LEEIKKIATLPDMARFGVSIIIPTMKGREELLKKLIGTIENITSYEIIVIDDADLLLAGKRNKGAKLANGRYLFFIDDDNYLKEFSIFAMTSSFEDHIGVMGMTACYDDKKMIVADGGSKRNLLTGFTRGLRTNEQARHKSNQDFYRSEDCYEVDEVANAFMILRHVFEEAGGFDEENFPIDLDEADLCKRIKNMGYRIVMNPHAICYHKSQTYSHIPNFRRPLNAYCMGNHRIRYQRKHLNALSYCVFIVIFLPVFVCFYTASLVWKRNPKMIKPFLHGVFDGLRNRRTNKYQQKAL
jgi:GT2 family glycosyltransferase